MTYHQSTSKKEAELGLGLGLRPQPRTLFLYTNGFMKTKSILILPHSYTHRNL